MKNTSFSQVALAGIVGLLLVGGIYAIKATPEKQATVDTQAHTTITSLTPDQFDVRLATDVTVIDIRTPEEIADGKVTSDALEMDYYSPNFKNELATLDKDSSYLIYCHSGNRSGDTLDIMESLGFYDVADLKGGKTAWEKSGRDLVAEDNPEVLTIIPDQGDVPVVDDTPNLVACTMDAKICSDGSLVGRIGPDCAFAPCPEE